MTTNPALLPSQRFVKRILSVLAFFVGFVWLLSLVPYGRIGAAVTGFLTTAVAWASSGDSATLGVASTFMAFTARHYTLLAFTIGLLWLLNVLSRRRTPGRPGFDKWADGAGIVMLAYMALVYVLERREVFVDLRTVPELLTLMAALFVLMIVPSIGYAHLLKEHQTNNPEASHEISLFSGVVMVVVMTGAGVSGFFATPGNAGNGGAVLVGHIVVPLFSLLTGITYLDLRRAEDKPTRTLYAEQ
jgi:hypothetical protein